MKSRFVVLAVVLAASAALAYLYADRVRALGPDEMARAVYLLLALILVGGGMWAGGRGPGGGRALRDLGLWALILVGAMGLYMVKDDFGAMLNPSAPRLAAARAGVEIRRADDGHFHADVAINGAALRMLVDTGATTVVLSRADARRCGIDLTKLSFSARMITGGGEVTVAPIILSSVRLGAIEARDVEAAVMASEVDGSVLGMSFLDRLASYEVRGDRLLMQPRP